MYLEGLWKYIGTSNSPVKRSKRIKKTLLAIVDNQIQMIKGTFRYGTYQRIFHPNILMTIEKDRYLKTKTGRILVCHPIKPIVSIPLEFTVKRNNKIVVMLEGDLK